MPERRLDAPAHAIDDLAVNQIVTSDMFSDPATVSSTFSDRLEKINDEDQVAVTISVVGVAVRVRLCVGSGHVRW